MAQRVIPVTHSTIHNPIQETLSILLANTDPTHWHSLHYVYLYYHVGLGPACVLLFYKPEIFPDSSWCPVSKHQFSYISSLQSAMPCNVCRIQPYVSQPWCQHFNVALALKTCPLGWIPGGKSSSSRSLREFCHQLQWPRNLLMWDIQQYGMVQWEVNPDCQLYTLLWVIEIIKSKLHKPISIWLSPKYCEICT